MGSCEQAGVLNTQRREQDLGKLSVQQDSLTGLLTNTIKYAEGGDVHALVITNDIASTGTEDQSKILNRSVTQRFDVAPIGWQMS